jgi:hypothetical protein
MIEVKFIITKDGKHFKSDWLHHQKIARDNGYSENEIIESGIIMDKQLFILECQDKKHVSKKKNNYLGRLDYFQDLRLMRAREVESRYMYKTEREGD